MKTLFSGNTAKEKKAAKWIIQVVTVCLLIYLGIRHIDVVTGAVSWLINLFQPLLIGIVFALILNVPMCPIERHLFCKRSGPRAQKVRRSLAIVLSLLLIFGIVLGVAFLVVPEIVEALPMISESVVNLANQMASQEGNIDLGSIPLGDKLSQITIDWPKIVQTITDRLMDSRTTIMSFIVNVAPKIGSKFVSLSFGFVLSIYILYNKEKLKRQVLRLVRAWLPAQFGRNLVHVASTFIGIFKHFIAGQTVEAIILGSLCTVGMMILRIPYAPMVGALVGVTALIPMVGAFIGTCVSAIIIMTVNPFKALVFVIFLLILQQVEGNLIYPRVVGSSTGLPAMWVLTAITAGGNLAGPFGMLLSVPIASALYTLLREATCQREQATRETNSDKEK